MQMFQARPNRNNQKKRKTEFQKTKQENSI